jgi:hypothetical protein
MFRKQAVLPLSGEIMNLMYLFNSVFLTVGPLRILEQINKKFEVPRKIPNVPRNRGNFFSAIGSAGLISVSYQLLLCFVFLFTVLVSSVEKCL